jgi:hypothetical protein
VAKRGRIAVLIDRTSMHLRLISEVDAMWKTHRPMRRRLHRESVTGEAMTVTLSSRWTENRHLAQEHRPRGSAFDSLEMEHSQGLSALIEDWAVPSSKWRVNRQRWVVRFDR